MTFNNGDTSKTFAVPLVQNNLVLGTVNFSVVLSNPTGGATLIAPTNATVNILDKNTGFAFANAATNTVIETAGFVAVNVLRIGDTSTSNVRSITPPSTARPLARVNYQSQSGTLSFAIGESLRQHSSAADLRSAGDRQFVFHHRPVQSERPGLDRGCPAPTRLWCRMPMRA